MIKNKSIFMNVYFKIICFTAFIIISYAWITLKLKDLHELFDYLDEELCKIKRELRSKN